MADATKIGVADATKMGVVNARVAYLLPPIQLWTKEINTYRHQTTGNFKEPANIFLSNSFAFAGDINFPNYGGTMHQSFLDPFCISSMWAQHHSFSFSHFIFQKQGSSAKRNLLNLGRSNTSRHSTLWQSKLMGLLCDSTLWSPRLQSDWTLVCTGEGEWRGDRNQTGP